MTQSERRYVRRGYLRRLAALERQLRALDLAEVFQPEIARARRRLADPAISAGEMDTLMEELGNDIGFVLGVTTHADA